MIDKKKYEQDPKLVCSERNMLSNNMIIAIGMFEKLQSIRLVETWRSSHRQDYLFEQGKSRTLNSRHESNKEGLSDAVDVVPKKGYDVFNDAKFKAKWISDWKSVATQLGYPRTTLLPWDLCHLSLNDGKHI